MIQETRLNQHSNLYIYTDQNSYEPLARIDKRGNDPEKVMYFHTDLNGCPEELTDENGKILWECSFQLWGKRIHEIEHEPIEQNLRYQGQYLDRETGLHYNTFRYYDPDIGRFTQPDPIGLLGGFNLYQYAPNGLTWIDPWGWACTLIKAKSKKYDYKLKLRYVKYPHTFGHIKDAISNGHPSIVTINRTGAKLNRKNSLKGIKTKSGYDRDEWPMAVFKEGGKGASVRYIDPSDNRGAGSSIGNVMSDLPDRTKIKIEVY
jgi:RHS repeat-associated protein